MKEQVLAKIIERGAYLWGKDVNELNADTTFSEVNAKSAHISQITTALEDEFDLEVPYMGFRRCKTLGEAADFVAELMEEQ